MLQVLACVISYSDPEALGLALASLGDMRAPARTTLSICVIDNTESEPVRERIRNLCALHAARFIALESNQGTAGAAYRARGLVLDEGYDYLWLWDQDSQAPPDCLHHLLESFSANDSDSRTLGMVGPKPVDPAGVDAFFVFYNDPYDISRMYHRSYPVSWIERGEVRTNFLISSGTLIRRDVLESVDGPDPSLFIDTIDFAWCSQVVEAGYRILLNCDTSFLHRVGQPRPRTFFSRTIFGRNYPPLRYYYQARNDLLTAARGSRGAWLRMLWTGFIRGGRIVLTEQHAWPKVQAHYIGWFHGLVGRRGKTHAAWMQAASSKAGKDGSVP